MLSICNITHCKAKMYSLQPYSVSGSLCFVSIRKPAKKCFLKICVVLKAEVHLPAVPVGSASLMAADFEVSHI
jgi:hypothetical protein